MNVKRIAVRSGAAGAALVAAIVFMGTNASTASAARHNCPVQEFCLWEDDGYDGELRSSRNDLRNLDRLHAQATSVWNRTSHDVAACYRDADGVPRCMLIRPGTYTANLGRAWNDTITYFDIRN